MLQHFRFIPLMIGLLLGIVGVYFVNPEGNITYKYPTLETAKVLIYKDKNGVCYKYNPKEVECDKNESRLKDFPLSK